MSSRPVGFNVDGREPGRVYASSGTQPGMRPNISGNLINGEPGLFTVQVYNYDPTTPIEFEITGLQNDPPPE